MTTRWIGYGFAGLCLVASSLLFYGGIHNRPRAVAVNLPPPPAGIGLASPPDAGLAPAAAPDAGPGLPAECQELPSTAHLPEGRDAQIEFCRLWIKLTPKPVPVDESRCGPPAVVAQLRLLDQCAHANGLCDLSKGARVDVKLVDILGVSQQFPTFIVYFGFDRSEVSNARALRSFVASEIARDARRALMIFGSASPTSTYGPADEKIARDRTDAAYRVVKGVLTKTGSMFVQTRKASVGRDLDANFCDALGRSPELERECNRLDANARRQAAFVISYPRACLGEDDE